MPDRLNTSNYNNENPIEWLYNTHPSVHVLSIDFVNKNEFPDYIQKYIKDCWILISDENSGTYKKPVTEQELLQKGMEIVGTKSTTEAMKYLLTDPKTGCKMSYAESRMMYG